MAYIGTITGLTIGNFMFQFFTNNHNYLFAFKISFFQASGLIAFAIANVLTNKKK